MASLAKPRDLIREATARLADAGVASPEYDAGALLAHVLGISPGKLTLAQSVTTEQAPSTRCS